MGWTEESRVAARIRERVAQIVLFELQDPRIEPARVTVTRVKVSRDLAYCDVFYSVLGDEGDRSKVAHALSDATRHIRREVGKVLRTRTIPRLRFRPDPAVEGGLRMGELLRRLKEESGEAEGNDEGEDGAEPDAGAAGGPPPVRGD